MPNWLKQRAELTPDRLAIQSQDENITFNELYRRVQNRASILKRSGVQSGQHVGILMKNSVEMIETIHAVISIGAVSVLLNTRLTTEELVWQLVDVEAVHIICHNELKDKVHTLKDKIQIVVIGDSLSVDNQFAEGIDVEFSHNQLATIMYTSGTTGRPKGVMQTFGNHWSSSVGSALNLGLLPSDRWLLAVPLFHISGLSIVMRSVIYGISIVLHEHFDAERMNSAIIKDKVTIVSVVTTMLQQMVENLDTQQYPDSFRCMLAGGGPIPKNLLEECQARNIPVYQTYGMTETASQIVTLSPEYSMTRLGSAGKPLFSCQIKIVKNGKECLPNEEGEILAKGPNITNGYWKRAEATQESLQDGWLHTGDQGYKDSEGFLFVLDRRSDLIISGGENVYPAEIEAVLLTHPNVLDAGVVGVDDERWGQIPHAYVVLRDSSINKDELVEYCKQRLAIYKVPKEYTSVDMLPRNASNKLLRRKLKEQ